MTKSDDPTGFGADTPGTAPEDHTGYQDPRYATPGTAQPTDPRLAQGAQYQGQVPTQTSQPAAYPGAGAPAAPAAGYPAATAQPAAPVAAAGPYGATPTADNSAGYGTSDGYPAAASSAGQHYAAAPSQPTDYSQYHQPAAQPQSQPEYPPATQYASASAPGSTPEQHARPFGGSDPSPAYGHSGSEPGNSGSHEGHAAYQADHPPAAGSDYGYAGAAASEPRSSFDGSRSSLNAGYSDPAAHDSHFKDYDSPFDTYSSATHGNHDQPGYQEPAHGEGYFDNPNQPDAEFYDGDYGDEDYPIKVPRRKRTVLVGGALVMALVVGGGLAYAYKNDYLGFDAVSQFTGSPPLIQADTKPAKTKPAEISSKRVGNGGKLIYDRLQGPAEAGKAAPEERVVARQESVLDAVSLGARSKSDKTAGAGSASPMARMEKAMPSNMKPDGLSKLMKRKSAPAIAAGPRKVKTLVVKPDGTVMKPPARLSLAAATSVPETINTASINQRPAKTNSAASLPATGRLSSSLARAPDLPKPKPKPQNIAALAAPQAGAATAAGTSSLFAVQIAARRTQTDALATFANLQQKYPNLLTPYQPLIAKADLGSKGIWYRLRIGPLNDKSSASNLCSKLKSAGLKSCLVRPL